MPSWALQACLARVLHELMKCDSQQVQTAPLQLLYIFQIAAQGITGNVVVKCTFYWLQCNFPEHASLLDILQNGKYSSFPVQTARLQLPCITRIAAQRHQRCSHGQLCFLLAALGLARTCCCQCRCDGRLNCRCGLNTTDSPVPT